MKCVKFGRRMLRSLEIQARNFGVECRRRRCQNISDDGSQGMEPQHCILWSY